MSFRPCTEEEVRSVLKSCPSKSCDLDPMPTWLVKSCDDMLVPLLTKIVNSILSTSDMPKDLKIASVKPLLKKLILDLIFKNFRPVSNLAFLGKLVKKVVLSRLSEHLSFNNLREMYQSAYIKGHSTETALLRVKNDILQATRK